MNRMLRVLAVALLSASVPQAQTPALTTVKDTVYSPLNGAPFNGTMAVVNQPFVDASGKPLIGVSQVEAITNGALAVALPPNTGTVPSGTSYTVRFYQSGSQSFTEQVWQVPTSSPVATPAAPTSIGQTGAAGAVNYCYFVSAIDAEGETLLGPATCRANSNATLSGTNYNTVNFPAVSGSTGCRAWRSTSTTPPTAGATGLYLVGSGSCGGSVNDQSNTLTSATVPKVNTTDPKTLQQVIVPEVPSTTVIFSATQVNGTAIVAGPSATQTITAPATSGVPLQAKGRSGNTSNVFETYDNAGTPALAFGVKADGVPFLPAAAAPTTDAAGELAFDNNAHATSRGAVQVYDGTAATYLVGALASDTPGNGQVPKWNTGGTITWEDDNTTAGADQVSVNGSALTDANLRDATPAAPANAANVKWQTSGSGPASVSAHVLLTDVDGAGVGVSGAELVTASQEAGFVADGGTTDLTCGASTSGKLQVMDSGVLQACDGQATAALRRYPLGDASGNANVALTGDSATSFFSAGQIESARGGTGQDFSAASGVVRVGSGTFAADASLNHLSGTLAGATLFTSDAEGEDVQISFTSNFSSDRFVVKQVTGNPTGGAVLKVVASDADPRLAVLESPQPHLDFSESDTTNTDWRLVNAGGDLYFQRITDAGALNDSQLQVGQLGLKAYNRISQKDFASFADADTTPSVQGGNLFKTGCTSGCTITALDDGVQGQEVKIVCTEANTTFTDGSTLKLAGGLTCTADDTLTLLRDGTNWFEVSRSVN